MNNILITGATGNVGSAVIKSLVEKNASVTIHACVRDRQKTDFPHTNNILPTEFDFTNIATYSPALKDCSTCFLLRPPQISDANKYFKPFIASSKQAGIKHVVFLSVQGAEKNSYIPHHKIEKLIADSGITYTFLRPAYFMQNLTTTLRHDIVKRHLIFLPAGDAAFTMVDVGDIGKVAAQIIMEPDKYKDKAFELTSTERLTFGEMTIILNRVLGTQIRYESPNLVRFYLRKRKERISPAFILVMMMLHYLPRFQKKSSITNCIEEITGKAPVSFEQFVQQNRNLLTQDALPNL